MTFRNCKQELGLEDPQNRVRPAVERTAPFGFLAYTLVIVWFAEAGEFRLKEYRRRRPWYRKKETPSFADMLEDIRREISARGVSVAPGAKKGRRKNAA